MNFIIDFQGVNSKKDIILRLSDTFELHDISGNSWDSFEDYFTNLDPDSTIIRESEPKPQEVFLTVKNIEEVKKISESDYIILCSILESATKKENRGDDIWFSYKIIS